MTEDVEEVGQRCPLNILFFHSYPPTSLSLFLSNLGPRHGPALLSSKPQECVDAPPSNEFTCEEQKSFGNCDANVDAGRCGAVHVQQAWRAGVLQTHTGPEGEKKGAPLCGRGTLSPREEQTAFRFACGPPGAWVNSLFA